MLLHPVFTVICTLLYFNETEQWIYWDIGYSIVLTMAIVTIVEEVCMRFARRKKSKHNWNYCSKRFLFHNENLAGVGFFTFRGNSITTDLTSIPPSVVFFSLPLHIYTCGMISLSVVIVFSNYSHYYQFKINLKSITLPFIDVTWIFEWEKFTFFYLSHL